MTSRRVFIADLARYAALAAVVPNDWRVRWRPRFADDPFTLGVASGDPTANGVTLWTRLAPRPFEPDGGMDGQRAVVTWELADDLAFTRIVKRGTATAAPELGYSVHVDVDGLGGARWFYYRFRSGDAVSAPGRTRTAPAAGALAPLRFAVASCQHYEEGLFTAYGHMARETDLDLVTHLGDYIYEYEPGRGRVRRHSPGPCVDLRTYRERYAIYKMDHHLRAAHALCPWVVTWDDHEVHNNYAGDTPEPNQTVEQERARRAAAYQAWWEHQPVRLPAATNWANLSITRAIEWGGLARFSVLDTRQYRSDQACADGTRVVPCGEWDNPTRTLMGDAQEKWLMDGVASSRARWQVLANQVMMAPFDNLAGDQTRVSLDQWSGYPVARDRLLGTLAERAANRTVVLTGDIHSSWVNELRSTFSKPGAPTIGAEFVCTSISSGGDGAEKSGSVTDATLAENTHLKWQSSRRGYISCTVSRAEWRSEYRTVPFVTRPDAAVETPAKFLVEYGRPGIARP
jgi:alkaline phosphatase D